MTREELHELVWSVPMHRLKASFGMSDTALAKHCRQASVPVPPRGWWARKEAGKPVEVMPLPELPIGEAAKTINLAMPADLGRPRAVRTGEEGPPEFPDIALFRAKVEEAVGEVKVPAKLTKNPHRIVARLLLQDAKRGKAHDPKSFGYDYHGPRFTTPIQQRRLRVMHALFGAMELHGCEVSGSTHDGHAFGLHVRSMRLTLLIGVENPAGEPYDHHVLWHQGRTGKPRLRMLLGDHELRADARSAKPFREWSDGDRSLDDRLTEALRWIVVFAEERRRAWAVQRHAWQVEDRRRQEQARRDAEAKAEAERIAREKAAAAARLKGLLDEAAAIGQADRIRAYVAEVRRRTADDPTVDPSEVEAWAQWALEEAERIDPVAGGKFLARLRAREGG